MNVSRVFYRKATCVNYIMSENEEASVLTVVPDNECLSSSCLQSTSSSRFKCKYCDLDKLS